nr:hypothetical protein [Rhodococcus sp. (in: high G+C Gram-positive bacteria)]
MALIHDAELSPSKLDMLRAWVPRQSWVPEQSWIPEQSSTIDAGELTILGAYRFDDSDDEVGIETFLVSSSAGVLQIPVTYRGAPLASAEASLICEMEHSVLGRRWAYDGLADAVYIRELARTILSGGRQADLDYDYPVSPEKLTVTTRVQGSGHGDLPAVGSLTPGGSTVAAPTDAIARIRSEGLVIDVVRVVDLTRSTASTPNLIGTWPGQTRPVVLALANSADDQGAPSTAQA